VAEEGNHCCGTFVMRQPRHLGDQCPHLAFAGQLARQEEAEGLGERFASCVHQRPHGRRPFIGCPHFFRVQSGPFRLPPIALSRAPAKRGQQALAGPEILLGHEAGEERADLGQDGATLRRPVGDELNTHAGFATALIDLGPYWA